MINKFCLRMADLVLTPVHTVSIGQMFYAVNKGRYLFNLNVDRYKDSLYHLLIDRTYRSYDTQYQGMKEISREAMLHLVATYIDFRISDNTVSSKWFPYVRFIEYPKSGNAIVTECARATSLLSAIETTWRDCVRGVGKFPTTLALLDVRHKSKCVIIKEPCKVTVLIGEEAIGECHGIVESVLYRRCSPTTLDYESFEIKKIADLLLR